MRLVLSAALLALGVLSGVGCRTCDSCYEHGPVVSGAPGCSTCGPGAAQPYYSPGAKTTTVPDLVPTAQP